MILDRASVAPFPSLLFECSHPGYERYGHLGGWVFVVLGLGGYERYAIFIGHPIAKLGTTTRLLRVFEEPIGGKKKGGEEE